MSCTSYLESFSLGALAWIPGPCMDLNPSGQSECSLGYALLFQEQMRMLTSRLLFSSKLISNFFR